MSGFSGFGASGKGLDIAFRNSGSSSSSLGTCFSVSRAEGPACLPFSGGSGSFSAWISWGFGSSNLAPGVFWVSAFFGVPFGVSFFPGFFGTDVRDSFLSVISAFSAGFRSTSVSAGFPFSGSGFASGVSAFSSASTFGSGLSSRGSLDSSFFVRPSMKPPIFFFRKSNRNFPPAFLRLKFHQTS